MMSCNPAAGFRLARQGNYTRASVREGLSTAGRHRQRQGAGREAGVRQRKERQFAGGAAAGGPACAVWAAGAAEARDLRSLSDCQEDGV
eukprot:scaffold280868_cov37-Prasinocladus_malaysianus.AAC.2